MARRPPPPGSTCYACSAPAVSWEHAPPKACYPKRGEVRLPKPKDLRSNLIQVPACKTHNNDKNRDDSYVASYIVAVASSIAGTLNPLAPEAFVERHIDNLHRGKRLSKTFFGNPVIVSTMKGDFNVISPEVETIFRFATQLAKALDFHDSFQKMQSWAQATKWHGTPRVIDMQLVDTAGSPGALQTIGLKLEESMIGLQHGGGYPSCQELGPHPEAFFYQRLDTPAGPTMRLVFYQAYRIIVLPERASGAE